MLLTISQTYSVVECKNALQDQSDWMEFQSESMEFSRPEYWSGQPFPSPGDLLNPGIEPRSSALQADSLPAETQGKPKITEKDALTNHFTFTSKSIVRLFLDMIIENISKCLDAKEVYFKFFREATIILQRLDIKSSFYHHNQNNITRQ